MYIPKYTITTSILRNIGQIEAAKEVIENAPLVPAWEAKFRNEARFRMAHYGTALEGNDLKAEEAKIVVESNMEDTSQAQKAGVMARDRDVQEVINYRRVIEYIEKIARETSQEGVAYGYSTDYAYSKHLLLDIHKLIVDKLIEDDKSGIYRGVQVVLKNSLTGEVSFRPPLAVEVPFLIDDFFRWLNSEYGRKEHAVIRAAVAHYVLAAVHPFVEGNGRSARAFATLILFMEQYDIKRFFALEEYFDKHSDEYFGALMQVSNQSLKLEDRDLTIWLETFTKALAVELVRIKQTVRELSVDIKIKEKRGTQVALSERQMKLVEYLNSNGVVTMSQARNVLPMVSEDTILRELKYLIEHEVIEKRGSTKAAVYALRK